jgi:hypothetical protein
LSAVPYALGAEGVAAGEDLGLEEQSPAKFAHQSHLEPPHPSTRRREAERRRKDKITYTGT